MAFMAYSRGCIHHNVCVEGSSMEQTFRLHDIHVRESLLLLLLLLYINNSSITNTKTINFADRQTDVVLQVI